MKTSWDPGTVKRALVSKGLDLSTWASLAEVSRDTATAAAAGRSLTLKSATRLARALNAAPPSPGMAELERA